MPPSPQEKKVFASFFKKKRLPFLCAPPQQASGSFLKKRTKKLSSTIPNALA
jgi:hypothetical protein